MKAAVLAYYVLAVAIATAAVVLYGRAAARSASARHALRDLFPWLQEHRTYPNVVSIVRFTRTNRAAWVIPAFAVAPTVAALVVAAAHGGDDQLGLGRLLSRLEPWRGVSAARGIATYVGLAAAYVAGIVVIVLIARRRGGREVTDALDGTIGSGPARRAAVLAAGPFIDEGGSLEELGWRGYALPLLLASGLGFFSGSAVLGVLWWAWHLPREVPTIARGGLTAPFVKGQASFLLLVVAQSVVITQVFVLTGGSAWSGILVHGGTNVWSKAVAAPMWDSIKRDVRTDLVVAAAIVITLVHLAVT